VRVKTDLLAGEWAVLALLCEQPRHGYAIASLMAPDGEIGRVWSLRRQMTYRSITALERLELIIVDSIEPGTTAPTRRIMRASADAEQRVNAWLQRPEMHVRDLRSLLLLKISFLRRRDASVTPLLQAQRTLLVEQERALATKRDQPDELDRMLAQWRWAMTDAALRFVGQMLVDTTTRPR
jgi:DNA-binding PadR family transcriptional regulator